MNWRVTEALWSILIIALGVFFGVILAGGLLIFVL